MLKFTAALAACLCCFVCRAQISIKGIVVSSANQQPVAYANIGIGKKNVGTISNEDGSFLLIIPNALKNDSIIISSIGFGEKKIAVQFFRPGKTATIFLTEKPKALPQVTVHAGGEKTKRTEIGSIAVRGGNLEADTAFAGRTLALLINDKDVKLRAVQPFPAILEKARLRIFRSNLSSFKFRVRVLAYDSASGAPGHDLFAGNIIRQSEMKKGWLTFDLTEHQIAVHGPFFIAFEQISDVTDRTAIANGYRDYISRHPGKLTIDTILIDGRKEVRQTLAGGIGLPGTFVGFSNSASRQENYVCYERESSFSEWKKTSAVIAATVTLAGNGNAASEEETACLAHDAPCNAKRFSENFMNESGLTGMQVAVSKQGKTVWAANLGFADAKNRIPVSDSTLFRINSISKSLTSLALVKLVSNKKLDLDAPVQKYIPDFPDKGYTITTRQLAGHLAGFRDYKTDDVNDYIRTEHFSSARAALDIFKNDTLLFKPGSRFSYSTFGWILIGAITEAAAGEAYEEYMRKNVWLPLGLRNTMLDDAKRTNLNRSKFYDAAGAESDLGDMSYKYAGGGLLSTVPDLLVIGNEILHGDIIDKKLKEMLFQTQFTSTGMPTGYGLGWYISKDDRGHRIWYHTGDSFSGSSALLLYPDYDLVVAFLANGQEGVNFDVRKIGEMFNGRE